jgi:glycosyltransferase involved in cell wall biosynthesis
VWPLDETAVVPHGPDLDRYPPVDVDVARPALSGRLLYIGRVAPEKGVATAVRALARLPDHHLDVFGAATPGFAAELRRLADGAGVSERLQLHGSAGPDRLRAAYDAADVLVFPSSWPEPFGIVPLEAMSRGAPVIATGTGGSGELLVEGLTALRFDAGDDAGLARRVHELADAPDTAATLRRNGVALARWLSRDRVSAELERWHWFAAGRAGRPSQRPLLPPELGSGG